MTKRLECLERIRLQSPPLPLALEVHWERRKLAYCKRLPEYHKEATGHVFINRVNLVVATLGKHYGGHLRVEKARSEYDKKQLELYQKKYNDIKAFEEFVIALEGWVPRSMINCTT